MNAENLWNESVTFPGIKTTGDGRSMLAGPAWQLLHWLEKRFRLMALEAGAEEWSFPSLIHNEVLRTAGYFESFPEGATAASPPGLNPDCSLAPAMCYHCYPLLARHAKPEKMIWTCQGRCFRHEQGNYHGLARLWEFQMREIVFCGPAPWVEEQRQIWMRTIQDFCLKAGLDVTFEPATDPFFGQKSRGQRLLQSMKKLKYEARLACGESETTAVASFNLHGRHFTKNFGIRASTDEPLFTGCVAFGLERWVLALMHQLGAERCAQLIKNRS